MHLTDCKILKMYIVYSFPKEGFPFENFSY